MIFPYNVDLLHDRWPIANWVLMGITVLVSLMLLIADNPEGMLGTFVLFRGDRFSFIQLFTHMFAHADFAHLVGNMLAMFAFGNAVNGRVPNWMFVPLYLFCGLVAGLAWLALASGVGAVGASGAIMGLLGATVMLYPVNQFAVFYWFGWVFAGTFNVPVIMVGIVYVCFDLVGVAMDDGSAGIAFMAHLGGAAAGFITMGVLLKTGVVRTTRADTTFLQKVGLDS